MAAGSALLGLFLARREKRIGSSLEAAPRVYVADPSYREAMKAEALHSQHAEIAGLKMERQTMIDRAARQEKQMAEMRAKVAAAEADRDAKAAENRARLKELEKSQAGRIDFEKRARDVLETEVKQLRLDLQNAKKAAEAASLSAAETDGPSASSSPSTWRTCCFASSLAPNPRSNGSTSCISRALTSATAESVSNDDAKSGALRFLKPRHPARPLPGCKATASGSTTTTATLSIPAAALTSRFTSIDFSSGPIDEPHEDLRRRLVAAPSCRR